MGNVLAWLEANWFSVVQSTGIIGSILLTALMLRRDRRGRRISDLLTLSQHHRDLWSEMHRRPELARIVRTEVDLVGNPITTAEEEYLMLVFTHFDTGWKIARQGSLVTLSNMAIDAGSFFTLPLPAHVWAHIRHLRDPRFVKFVDDAVRQWAERKNDR